MYSSQMSHCFNHLDCSFSAENVFGRLNEQRFVKQAPPLSRNATGVSVFLLQQKTRCFM
jgi:hypothetical protein